MECQCGKPKLEKMNIRVLLPIEVFQVSDKAFDVRIPVTLVFCKNCRRTTLAFPKESLVSLPPIITHSIGELFQ